MGYFISAFATRSVVDPSRLVELPKSIGYRALQPRGAEITLVDVYRPGSRPEFPFTQALPSADIPLEMPDSSLEALFKFLLSRRIADGFKRSYINAARQLSQYLGQPVLALVGDDDGLDFTCQAVSGGIDRIATTCGDLSITYAPGSLSVQTLVPASEDFEEEFEATDVTALTAAVPGIAVVPGSGQVAQGMHVVAAREFTAFTGQPASLLGLGDFDAEIDPKAFKVLVQR